jgi:SMODS-associated and fused to various effectors sensor domain
MQQMKSAAKNSRNHSRGSRGRLHSAPRITRHVPTNTQCMLWGRAAGRCEFSGCNRALWKSGVTQERVNVAQKAHIYSFSSDGPRGNTGIPRSRLNTLENLLLVCHECHQKIDADKDGGRYHAQLLEEMKSAHEQRIELVTDVVAEKRSHVLLYGANVGDHSSPLNYQDAAPALFPERYPAADTPIELNTVNSSFLDRDAEFWKIEADNLQRKFDQRVRERLATGGIEHLSIFALAPQPLLILLGTFLGDIVPADVYQRHREPPTWNWPSGGVTPLFEIRAPESTSGPPALVLALSATVTADRIASVVASNVSIWTVTVPTPSNDLMKSRDQLSQLRSLLRNLLDRIKAAHGQTTCLHVFPAASVSAAVEFGRIRMPKADMPWLIYDQVNVRGGFIPTLSIPNGA